MIDANTIPAFILGDPVKHSLSPVFQNAAFNALNINAVYLALHIEKQYFDIIVNCLKKIQILGFNVTVPYKTEIIKFCDELSDHAKKIESVNTIEVKDGKWIGHNTDWCGVFMTLKENNVDKNIKALLIGAGGAANGVIYGMEKYGINNITIINRTLSRAENLSRLFNVELKPFDEIKNAAEYSLIVNCTTLPFSQLIKMPDEKTIYFDLKYYTDKMNAKNYIDGLPMLLHQGAMSFNIWTKKEAPLEIMKNAIGL